MNFWIIDKLIYPMYIMKVQRITCSVLVRGCSTGVLHSTIILAQGWTFIVFWKTLPPTPVVLFDSIALQWHSLPCPFFTNNLARSLSSSMRIGLVHSHHWRFHCSPLSQRRGSLTFRGNLIRSLRSLFPASEKRLWIRVPDIYECLNYR